MKITIHFVADDKLQTLVLEQDEIYKIDIEIGKTKYYLGRSLHLEKTDELEIYAARAISIDPQSANHINIFPRR